METFVWVGTGVLLLLVVVNMVRALSVSRAFERYLRENHRAQWERIYRHQWMKKALLWPVMRNTPVDFGWKSQENFGDPRITELRGEIRRRFLGTIVSMIATFAWFGVGALVLHYFSRR